MRRRTDPLRLQHTKGSDAPSSAQITRLELLKRSSSRDNCIKNYLNTYLNKQTKYQLNFLHYIYE